MDRPSALSTKKMAIAAGGFGILAAVIDFNLTEVQPVAVLIIIGTFVLGFLAPRHAWRWSFIVGISFPVVNIIALILGYTPAFISNGESLNTPFTLTLALISGLSVIPALVGTYSGVILHIIRRNSHNKNNSKSD